MVGCNGLIGGKVVNLLTKPTRKDVFLEGVSQGIGLQKSGKRATLTKPQRDGVIILSDRTAAKLVRDRVDTLLRTDGLAAAYRYLRRTIDDEGAPHAVRVRAAQIIIESAGKGPMRARDAQADDEPLDVNAMTPDRLREFIAAAEAKLASSAKPAQIEELPAIAAPQSIEDLM